MADWRAMAMDLVLSDGTVDADETAILRRHVFADGRVTHEEFEFLLELRRRAGSASREFRRFFFECLRMIVLEDGVINAAEARWLERMILADARVDEDERELLQLLKRDAGRTCPEFDALCARCLGDAKTPGAGD